MSKHEVDNGTDPKEITDADFKEWLNMDTRREWSRKTPLQIADMLGVVYNVAFLAAYEDMEKIVQNAKVTKILWAVLLGCINNYPKITRLDTHVSAINQPPILKPTTVPSRVPTLGGFGRIFSRK